MMGAFRRFSTSLPQEQFRAGMGFIRKARLKGARSLIGQFETLENGYDEILSGMVVEHIEEGKAVCSLRVEKSMTNAFDTLHGGVSSTIVDVLGTLALLSKDNMRPGISIELNICFLKPACVGDQLTLYGSVLKYGKKVGFTEVQIMKNDEIIATGRHTKYFVPS